MKINLIPTPYRPTIRSKRELMELLQADKDFVINDVSSKWDGANANLTDLLSDGYTHAQIRYGKNLTSVWYGELPEVKGLAS